MSVDIVWVKITKEETVLPMLEIVLDVESLDMKWINVLIIPEINAEIVEKWVINKEIVLIFISIFLILKICQYLDVSFVKEEVMPFAILIQLKIINSNILIDNFIRGEINLIMEVEGVIGIKGGDPKRGTRVGVN